MGNEIETSVYPQDNGDHHQEDQVPENKEPLSKVKELSTLNPNAKKTFQIFVTFCKQCSARRKVENFSATFVKRQVKIEVMLKNMQKLTLKASNTHVSNVTMFAAAGLP